MKHVFDPERNLEGAASLAPKFGRRRSAAFHCVIAAAFLLGLAFGDSSALAAIGNAWHIPDSTELGSPVRMRFEEFFFGPNGSFDVYNGNQFQGGGNVGDQSGGSVFFKGASENLAVGSWHSAPLNFYKESGNNKYWKATINTTGISGSDPILYYLQITYADAHQPTFLYGSDAASNTSASETIAAGSPFSVRNRAAFVFHANNRVILPGADLNHNDVQFWAKIGHINRDAGGTQWTDHACLYYTIDGSAPAGALGVGTGTTQVAVMHYDHEENDPSPAGNAMWWFGAAANLPNFNIQPANTPIRYKIGVWNSSNNEEKFADYNAGTNAAIFSFNIGTIGDPNLTVNEVNANYTTTHVFVDEIAGDSIPLAVGFSPNATSVDPASVQVFTNLNRRDFATLTYPDANGLLTEEGIQPPSGDLVTTSDAHYYKAFAMATGTGDGLTFTATLNAQKTGAYRLTARYQKTTDPNPRPWYYYTTAGRRDHAIVVSPKQSRDIVLYELNTINIESQGTLNSQRSTFVDLWDGPGARAYNATTARFNLDYVKNLGCNWLWFQPIHPNGIDGRQIDPATSAPYEVGSPYAVKNFFEVMPLMSKANTRAAARIEFHDFVVAADGQGVGVMLDAPFNHTSYDTELSSFGVNLFRPDLDHSHDFDEIRNSEARFFSKDPDGFGPLGGDYCQRASGAGTIAVAPDRSDFGKFGDTYDVYFGRYSALVCQNPSDNANYLNEGDVFFGNVGGDANWTSVDRTVPANLNITRNVWKYFAQYVPFWLDQTGHPQGNSTSADGDYAVRLALDSKGIDGLRADFGQGLAPQCWEYIINVARSKKWNFVFMTESLDGGAVTYRSNRHFDILNENIVFPFQAASTTDDYRSIFDGRRSAYGQSLVLLNNTSHDEETYSNPFDAFVRYSVAGSIDGAPMIFYGQELGVSKAFGFDAYEVNFGKNIPQFKKYNSLQPIFDRVNPSSANYRFDLAQLYGCFGAVNQARNFSRALRSSNRYYLNQTGGGGVHSKIFSVAKYETANASPNVGDVVFAFANLDLVNDQQGNFDVNIPQNPPNLFGIKTGRTYNVKNIAAYTGQVSNRRDIFLWADDDSDPTNGVGRKASNILTNGVYVSMNKVPTTDGAWSTAPYEAQYLKVYDVTPPPTGGTPGTPKPYVLVNSVTFSWSAATDPDGGISGYHVKIGTAPGGNDIFDGIVTGTSVMVSAAYGQTLYATVRAVNNAGIESNSSVSSSGIIVLDPTGDQDGDGMKNADEDTAGTDPLNPTSIMRITSITRPDSSHVTVTWSSVSQKVYVLQSASAPGGPYSDVGSQVPAMPGATTFETISTTTPPTGPFYRVRLGP